MRGEAKANQASAERDGGGKNDIRRVRDGTVAGRLFSHPAELWSKLIVKNHGLYTVKHHFGVFSNIVLSTFAHRSLEVF